MMLISCALLCLRYLAECQNNPPIILPPNVFPSNELTCPLLNRSVYRLQNLLVEPRRYYSKSAGKFICTGAGKEPSSSPGRYCSKSTGKFTYSATGYMTCCKDTISEVRKFQILSIAKQHIHPVLLFNYQVL